ncbi:hypothetical protein BXZ70DRAFT_689623 [Cristinia sonorae]|uniref:Uncharacterized protein n=1 Tax=Cristinia sonorae TaxID=1940300 RepID=A0A8K0XJX0_9AGAR|nr:hypothetical protein BXZ70DRAFT_689623 [Cristinia sonorae]
MQRAVTDHSSSAGEGAPWRLERRSSRKSWPSRRANQIKRYLTAELALHPGRLQRCHVDGSSTCRNPLCSAYGPPVEVRIHIRRDRNLHNEAIHVCSPLPEKERKAHNIAHGCFAAEAYTGRLPVREGRLLYTARVDPHLTSGAEICLDADGRLLDNLIGVQRYYLPHLLSLQA